ncbi:branched-chain amino acid ABC transporter permease [Neobacillus sp. BF23-41]|uniref:branched-chain amino acid ABC transporter permease n=1 Tax=Neobacillus sp. BF23-41 TaxID=3240280 RepID=UPI0034E40F37
MSMEHTDLVSKTLIQRKKFDFMKLDWWICLFIASSVVLTVTFADSFYQRLVTEMMIFALLAISLDLLLGYTGLLSLGHAIFFGISGLVAATLFVDFHYPLLLALFVSIMITMVIAFIIALVNCRFSGIQFAMLTIAFGQFFWTLAVNWRQYTGGHDGKTIVDPLTMNLVFTVDLKDPGNLTVLTGVILILSYLVLRKIINSPFGKILVAIKENESRAIFLGFNSYRVKIQVFMFGAFFSSISGLLYFLLKSYVIADNISWVKSGDILLMTLVGGMGTIFGPMLGATFFVWFKDWSSSFTENWMFIIGILYIIVVLFFPKGAFGWLNKSK